MDFLNGTDSPPPLILLAGPTATGKTALAVALARRLGGEVVSADSMQVYRGCAIGTAQPSLAECAGVPYHLVDRVAPWKTWTVAHWLRATRSRIARIHQAGRVAIVAGGTGLYFKALTEGLFESAGAGRNAPLRAELDMQWDADAGSGLRQRLWEVDPEAAARIHPNDRLRILRAIEVYQSAGQSMSALQAEDRKRRTPLQAWRFVLCAGREGLYRRIDQRVEEMFERGFEEEVRRLLVQGATGEWPAMRALGYLQVARWLRGEWDRGHAIAETQQISRRYAKQQLVLFRRWSGAIWLDADRNVERNASLIENLLAIPMPDAF